MHDYEPYCQLALDKQGFQILQAYSASASPFPSPSLSL